VEDDKDDDFLRCRWENSLAGNEDVISTKCCWNCCHMVSNSKLNVVACWLEREAPMQQGQRMGMMRAGCTSRALSPFVLMHS
jgi:hypothetical protein